MGDEHTTDEAEESPPARTIEDRLDELERRGELVRAEGPRKPLRPIATIPGALERFLAERGRSWERPYCEEEPSETGSD
ncbi:MAG: hypothetical protein OXC56_07270 [Chloroflexi bacterium]|nr:hypothetical protein [Chloroflexota bacterium]